MAGREHDRVIIIGNGRLLEHDSIIALKNRHRRIVELAPGPAKDRYVAVLAAATGTYAFRQMAQVIDRVTEERLAGDNTLGFGGEDRNREAQ